MKRYISIFQFAVLQELLEHEAVVGLRRDVAGPGSGGRLRASAKHPASHEGLQRLCRAETLPS